MSWEEKQQFASQLALMLPSPNLGSWQVSFVSNLQALYTILSPALAALGQNFPHAALLEPSSKSRRR